MTTPTESPSPQGRKAPPIITFGAFAVATTIFTVGLVGYLHTGKLWPLGVACVLATLVNIAGVVSPTGSPLWFWSKQEHPGHEGGP